MTQLLWKLLRRIKEPNVLDLDSNGILIFSERALTFSKIFVNKVLALRA